MKTWKTAPTWFNLDNYSDSANFTSKEWAYEIDRRITSFLDITEPNKPISFLGVTSRNINDIPTKQAYKFFDHLKNYPLINKNSRNTILDRFITLRATKGGRKFASIEELSEFQAYSFLFDSDRKKEIEKDYLFIHSPRINESIDQDDHVEQKIKIVHKYSQPIADLQKWVGTKFLEINLDASNELILEEFKDWLVQTRSNSNEGIKRRFSSADFEDWSSSRLLPYWDLTTIATMENSIIPFHVLGKILFPDEYEVDLAERIRKITKKKCQYLFTHKVVVALYAQSQHDLSKTT